MFYGTTGPGSVMHLSAETLKRDTGIKMDHVPFRGAAPLVQELLTGRIQLGGDQISTSLGHVRGGALTALATLSPARTVPLPDLLTVREQGFPNMELFGWNGFFAPAKTPPAVVAAIQAEMAEGCARSGREAPPRRRRRRGDGLDPGRTRQGAARPGRGGASAGRGAEAGGAVTRPAATDRVVVGAVAAFVFSLLPALAAAWLLTDYYWYGEDLDLFVWPIASFALVSSVVFGTTSMRAQDEGALRHAAIALAAIAVLSWCFPGSSRWSPRSRRTRRSFCAATTS